MADNRVNDAPGPMNYLKRKLRNWLVPELLVPDDDKARLAIRIDDLQADLNKIKEYLEPIALLADHVQETDQRAANMLAAFATITDHAQLSPEEAKEELITAYSLKGSILDSPAIGSQEIKAKNDKLFHISEVIGRLEASLK